jgi:hypothetical protein
MPPNKILSKIADYFKIGNLLEEKELPEIA